MGALLDSLLHKEQGQLHVLLASQLHCEVLQHCQVLEHCQSTKQGLDAEHRLTGSLIGCAEEAVKEAEPEEATVAPAEEVKEEATPVETAPLEIAPIEAPVPKEEETLPEPEAVQADEVAPVEAPVEASAHKDDLPEAAQVEEPAALALLSKPATEAEAVHEEEKPEDVAEHEQAQAETEAAAAVEPEQAPDAVEEPAAEVSCAHPTMQCLFRLPSTPWQNVCGAAICELLGTLLVHVLEEDSKVKVSACSLCFPMSTGLIRRKFACRRRRRRLSQWD